MSQIGVIIRVQECILEKRNLVDISSKLQCTQNHCIGDSSNPVAIDLRVHIVLGQYKLFECLDATMCKGHIGVIVVVDGAKCIVQPIDVVGTVLHTAGRTVTEEIVLLVGIRRACDYLS